MKNNKILKIISLCALILSFVFFVIALIMPAVVIGTGQDADSSTTGSVLLGTYGLLVVYTVMLGLAFIFLLTVNNQTVKNLGKGLYSGVSIISFVVFFDLVLNLKKYGAQGVSLGFGAIALILGIVFYVVYLSFEGLKCVLGKSNEIFTVSDPVEEIKRWKQLLDDNAITEEEYALKKKEILKIEDKDAA